MPSAGVGRAAAGEDRHGILEELQHSYVEDSAAGLGVSLRGAQRVPLKQGSCANDSTLQAIFARQHVVRGRHRARCLADRVCYRLSTLFSPPKTTYVPACAYHIYLVQVSYIRKSRDLALVKARHRWLAGGACGATERGKTAKTGLGPKKSWKIQQTPSSRHFVLRADRRSTNGSRSGTLKKKTTRTQPIINLGLSGNHPRFFFVISCSGAKGRAPINCG